MTDVTIVMPAFNVENYISASIESVLNQTASNWELIIINDGSTDSTEAIITHYARKDPRIILINQNNQGVSAARNKGLSHAKGKYISFLDADDLYDKNYIDYMSIPLKNGSAEMTVSLFKEIDNTSTISQSHPNSIKLFNPQFIQYAIKTRLAMTANMATMYITELILKKNITFQVGCNYGEDAEFVLKYAYATKAHLVPHHLYYYVSRKGSASHSGYSYDLFFGEIDAYMRVIDFVKKHENLESELFISHMNVRIIEVKNRIKRTPWRSIKNGDFNDALTFLNRYKKQYGDSFNISFNQIDSKKFWLKMKILKTQNKFLWKLVRKRK